MGLELNEIGDSFAGFAGFLAFLWLIVTVLLQNTELRLQRKEVSGLKGASEDQAKSLKASLQVQTLTFMRDRQREVTNTLLDKHQHIGKIMANFLSEYVEMKFADEFINSPHQGVTWMLGFFLDEETPNDIDLKSVRSDVLKQNFDYKAYLALSNMLYLIDKSWEVCKPIYRDAADYGYMDDFESWISQLDISWYRDYYAALSKFNQELRVIIARGGIASDLATHFINAIEVEELQKQSEIPFTDRVT